MLVKLFIFLSNNSKKMLTLYSNIYLTDKKILETAGAANNAIHFSGLFQSFFTNSHSPNLAWNPANFASKNSPPAYLIEVIISTFYPNKKIH